MSSTSFSEALHLRIFLFKHTLNSYFQPYVEKKIQGNPMNSRMVVLHSITEYSGVLGSTTTVGTVY